MAECSPEYRACRRDALGQSIDATVELELHLHADHVATLGGTLVAIRDRLNHGERLHLRVTVDPDAPLTLTLGLRIIPVQYDERAD